MFLLKKIKKIFLAVPVRRHVNPAPFLELAASGAAGFRPLSLPREK